jgi:hypothetical protein
VPLAQHPPGARVHDDHPVAAKIAVKAPPGAVTVLVGVDRVLADDVACIPVGAEHPLIGGVLRELARREIAEVLVDPVRHVGADDALVPPGLRANVLEP